MSEDQFPPMFYQRWKYGIAETRRRRADYERNGDTWSQERKALHFAVQQAELAALKAVIAYSYFAQREEDAAAHRTGIEPPTSSHGLYGEEQ